MHRRGIATLLLEHLVSLARARGMKTIVAEVLPDNYPVLRVLSDAGLAVRRRYDDGVVDLSVPVPLNAALGEASMYLDAVGGRDMHANVASLEPLLAPRSAAVVGSGGPTSVGRTILLNIRHAGFAGALYPVDPHGGDIEGIPCVASVAELPEAPDLAVITVPAARVVEVAQECGRRGIRSLVVVTSGLTPPQESGLLDAVRQGSMRLVGPSSFGVAVPGIGLEATFAVHHPSPGKTGLVAQSGGVGAALVEQFARLGIGVSSFASVGDRLDVSGTDMLLWWEADGATELAVLYLESGCCPATAPARPCPRTPTRKRPPGRWPGPPATARGDPGRPARYRSSATFAGGRALDRDLVPGPDAGRRLAVRRGGRQPAALLRPPDGGVPPGRRRRRGRRAAAGFGGHVVIKADVPGLLHKTEAGAVELDLHGPGEVRAAMSRLLDKFAGRMNGVLVEPMITGGIETIVGMVQEPVFGPVVVFGLGGVATEALGDHVARLAPLTGADADDLIHSIRAVPALLGNGGQPAVDLGALRGTLLRISRLADDLPEVAELDLNPVIARPDGVTAADARIRVSSHRLADPFLRQLSAFPHA